MNILLTGADGFLGRHIARALGGCRTWNVESENRPQRGQFLPDLQPHSPAMGQKDGEKWTAAVDLQPTISKSDSLLGQPSPQAPRAPLQRRRQRAALSKPAIEPLLFPQPDPPVCKPLG